LIISQRKHQNTVSPVAQTAIPEALVDGDEGWLLQTEKDFWHAVVENVPPRM
jgi:hypothetical protein